jgi:hypothetical protein
MAALGTGQASRSRSAGDDNEAAENFASPAARILQHSVT